MKLNTIFSAVLIIFLSVTAMASSSWWPSCDDMEYTVACRCDRSYSEYIFIHARATQKARNCNDLSEEYVADDEHRALDLYAVCYTHFLHKLDECTRSWDCDNTHRSLKARYGGGYCKKVYDDHCPGSDCYYSDEV